jgi:hypothetical protein
VAIKGSSQARILTIGPSTVFFSKKLITGQDNTITGNSSTTGASSVDDKLKRIVGRDGQRNNYLENSENVKKSVSSNPYGMKNNSGINIEEKIEIGSPFPPKNPRNGDGT